MSGDPRVEAYAKLLVETCVDVQPGWQVLVTGSYLARPLLEEVSRQVGRRGAYAIQRANLTGYGTNIPWALEAREDLLGKPAAIDAYAFDNADGLISIEAPENTRELTGLPAERLTKLQSGHAAAHGADVHARAEVGGLPVPDSGSRAGRWALAPGVRGLPLRRLPAELGR